MCCFPKSTYTFLLSCTLATKAMSIPPVNSQKYVMSLMFLDCCSHYPPSWARLPGADVSYNSIISELQATSSPAQVYRMIKKSDSGRFWIHWLLMANHSVWLLCLWLPLDRLSISLQEHLSLIPTTSVPPEERCTVQSTTYLACRQTLQPKWDLRLLSQTSISQVCTCCASLRICHNS